MTEIMLGDVVQLKSGSEDMTYSKDAENGDAVCNWRDQNGTDRTATYAKILLKKAPPKSGSIKIVRG